ncbi:MAG: DUF1552 domain-containing protein [Acidobacteria bacterium]|nr:DUF1552 domain-containing protein [Acidobacteriota bacterium]
MMVFKKAISRRTVLRGLGASFALPLMDSMVPAFATAAQKAVVKPPVRLGFLYVPDGIIMDKWTPATVGAGFEMTPVLESLTPFRDRLLVLSELSSTSALPRPGEDDGQHPRAATSYLTGSYARKTGGKDTQAGISVDQVAAKEFGKHTQLASLELALGTLDLAGICDSEFTCAYTNTISWRTPTTPMPMENKPRAVFERLFGDNDTTDRSVRLARIRRDRSLLDSIAQDVADLQRGLGAGDRDKLAEYLDAVRDVERRVTMAEQQSEREVPTLERPVGIPASYEDHAKLMFDLQVLAFQSDLTRVTTFMMGREGTYGSRPYPEIGIVDMHHTLSHHQNDADKIAKLVQINRYHMTMFAYFLEKLRSTPDGDGNLLDHSALMYGSGLSNGNLHLRTSLPILMVGGGGGQIKGGRHLTYAKDTPLPNLHLTMLDIAGVPVEKHGDSTGKLDLLSIS